LHWCQPLTHWTPHTLFVQVALPPAGGCGQLVVQTPQWLGSFVVSLHVVPQRVVPAGQLAAHPAAAQTSPAAHAFAQSWQCATEVRSVSQPSWAFVEQWAKFVAHAACGMVHAPALHVTPVVLATCCSAVQSFPQRPQFFTSFDVSTQSTPH